MCSLSNDRGPQEADVLRLTRLGARDSVCLLSHSSWSAAVHSIRQVWLRRCLMTRRTSVGLGSAIAVLILAVVGWIVVAQGQRGGAQQAPPQRQRVEVTHVKPEMVQAYQDLIKDELIPNLKKAGIAYRWTWANGPAGDSFTFVNEQPIANYAQYDQPGALQRVLGADGVAKYQA